MPSPTALAATWDCERVEAIGRLLAHEGRRKGVDVLLAPTVNLHRTPYGGRHFECFSEDPLLTARIGVAYVSGLQRAGVAGCVKHFVGNDSETQRFTVDVRIDERTLRELYLAPFEAIVREAGAWAVMASYNGVNGSTLTESPLLRDILHRDWDFDGLVMSDWTATRSTVAAARAALDLAMPGPASQFGPWGDALLAAVTDGEVDEALIDDKVLRILRLAGRVGALTEGPPHPRSHRTARRRSRVTCAPPRRPRSCWPRNDGVLPLPRTGLGRVAVIGPNAELARTLGGGSATVFPPYTISPLDGLRGAGLDVTYAPGTLGHLRTAAARAPWLLRPDGSSAGRRGPVLLGLRRAGRLAAARRRRVPVDERIRPGGPARADHQAGDQLRNPGHRRGHLSARGLRARAGPPAPRRGRALRHHADRAGGGGRRRTADGTAPAPGPGRAGRGPVGPRAARARRGLLADGGLRHVPPARPGGAPRHDDEEIAAAVELAAASDVAVVVVGTTAEVESEGFDRASLALPGRQDELVRRVAAANPRTVVVVNSGAPVLLPWAGDVAAVLLTWFGGQEFGHALADVLLGDTEPGGRLPTTWPATEAGLPSTQPAGGVLPYTEGAFIGYRGYDRDGREPLFPFGSGTGYTTWSYESITVDRDPAGPGGPTGVAVCVEVRNTGARRGREVVQVYASRPDSAVERPVKWLAGFAAVDADPGETVNVGILIPERAFQHWFEKDWAVEPGSFTLSAGPCSASLPLTGSVTVE